jgi:hypothetical protein
VYDISRVLCLGFVHLFQAYFWLFAIAIVLHILALSAVLIFVIVNSCLIQLWKKLLHAFLRKVNSYTWRVGAGTLLTTSFIILLKTHCKLFTNLPQKLDGLLRTDILYHDHSNVSCAQILVVEASKILTLLDKLCTIVFQKSFKK